MCDIKIHGLNEILVNNDLIKIINSTHFYIKKKEKIIPWYDIFTYFFYKINDKLYLHNVLFDKVKNSYFIDNNYVNNIEHVNLLKNINFKQLNINKAFILTYTHSNAGHLFSEIMHQIHIYFKNNLYDYNILITKELLEENTFIKSIIYYFFTEDKIIIYDEYTVLSFDESFIFKYSNGKESNSINFLLNKLKKETIMKKMYNNICLIKTHETKNQNPLKSFSCDYSFFIEQQLFNIIIPENYNIEELFNIIYNADNIIMSWGCCSYLNGIFVNENSNFLLLCHEKYNNEYNNVQNIFNSGWFPEKCKNKNILYDLPCELDELVKKNLQNKINVMLDKK